MVTSRPQRRVADRYLLQRALGRGGMGVVWLAEDTVLQRKVAVKEVEFPAGVPAEEIDPLRERVMREARAAGRLNHPNVTTIYDVVRDEGSTWIVMEYVDAPTLTEIVGRDGPLSVQRTAEIGIAVLGALEAAHAAGIVHRDVKPGNVMAPEVGNVKLADFGIAAVQGDPKITMTGLIIGSPAYMAPEQAQEGVSTPASDMWGLGATLYYAVEGQPAFDKGAAIPTLTAVTYEPHRPMQRAGDLAPIIDRLLSKKPDERPTAGELHHLLDEVAGLRAGAVPSTVVFDEPDPAPQATRPLTATAAAPPADDDEWGADDRALAVPHRRSAWPWIALAAALLIAAVVFLPGLLSTEAPPEQAQQEEEPARQGNNRNNQGADPDATAAPADEEETATAAPADDEPHSQVPPDWETYSVADTGTKVAHPPDWTVTPRSATASDIVDPGGGRYLRVDYTTSPKDDAVADWQAQSASFGARHSNYNEIKIEPFDYEGADTAALWEYTYEQGGAQLHAYNLAIVTGGRGYALNFQTREAQWAQSQKLWEQFVAGFEPAG